MVEVPAALLDRIGAAIRERRLELSMSADEAAAKAGVSSSHLREIEHGRSPRLSVAMAVTLADALDLPRGALLDGETSAISERERRLILAHREIFGRDPASDPSTPTL